MIGRRCKLSNELSRALLISRYFTWLAINDHFEGRFGGGYAGVVPPVPIPNTEVKYSKADDSALRESR